MGKRPNSRGVVEVTSPLHYFYVRVGEGKSATIRCEKARGPRHACQLAFGVIYDGPDDTVRYKDIGAVKPAYLSAKKKRELEEDKGWLPIPPAEGERRRLPISTPVVDKKHKVPCATCKRMVQGSIMDGELTCGVCGTLLQRVKSATKQTPTTASPLATKLKDNGATKPKEAPPKVEASKCARWIWIQEGTRPSFAILQIVNGDSGDYLFQRLTAEEFRLTKLEEDRATSYTVSIGKVQRCGCEGFKRRQTCKHVDALLALRKEGKL